MPLKLAPGVRETVPGHGPGDLPCRRGADTVPCTRDRTLYPAEGARYCSLQKGTSYCTLHYTYPKEPGYCTLQRGPDTFFPCTNGPDTVQGPRYRCRRGPNTPLCMHPGEGARPFVPTGLHWREYPNILPQNDPHDALIILRYTSQAENTSFCPTVTAPNRFDNLLQPPA